MSKNVLLLHYMRCNKITDDLIYREPAINQMCYMRDIIGGDVCHVPMFVVSTHMSKSIQLPVYGFVMRNGVKVIARENFYGWVVSVELPHSLPLGYLDMDLFSCKDEVLSPCYCEGFKDEWIYGLYDPVSETCQKFTMRIDNNYKFYMLMFLLNNAFPTITFSDIDRSVSDIEKSIENIFDYNGKYLGDNMSSRGWEILWYTYYKLHNIIGYNDDRCTEDATMFAESILQYTEVYQEFLMEEYMFNTTF